MFGSFALCDMGRVLVADPASIHAVHMNPVGVVLGSRRARHHIESSFGHIGMGMFRGLETAVKLPLYGRHIHDVFVLIRSLQHEWLESSVQHKGCNCVHELCFEHLNSRDLRQVQPPRVEFSQVDLLKVLVEEAVGKQVALTQAVLFEQW